ncbi:MULTISPECIES: hypothetical protein [Rhizobium/Agrobacterium group]|uniref:EF-hand domain-containing protein n=2 Tax=Rhizobium/Agrobacterium group TaxID=227290 RepID=B9JUP4_ALLAM|nr:MULTISPECIES: hypothetical protein [Rhizobium/Agrobacterium group]ACM36039.1 Conserved hypothetical protein [Allorhizobium ampelinum S4]MCF1449932.1 hypothetical protein [Allorhizobium ampelinum]MCF1482036.1 hypothetical protein [Allorhizobium ampelinum]MCF1492163.1 hypothetical protein [Allorhizobium ampelinum]MUO29678.1 hypothetical protein [Agrobacterium vitis]
MTSVSSASLSSVSSYNVGSTSSLDTNSDGVVSAEEQSAGSTRTQDPTVLSDSAANSTSSQLSSDMMAMVLARGDSSSTDQNSTKSIDTDSDGKVTKEEFVNARPEGASEEDSTKMFEAIDSDDAGYVTEDQLQSETKMPPPMMMGGMGGMGDMQSLSSMMSGDSSGSEDSMSMDDVFSQMSSVINAYRSAGGTADETDTTGQTAAA